MLMEHAEGRAVMVTVIGIDCAVQDENVGLARALWDGRRTEVTALAKGGQGRPVVEIIREWIGNSTATLLALDAPLGWPKPLGEQLVKHRAGLPMKKSADAMFRRETDRHVRAATGKQSLDVGADRIARTAHAALALLGSLAKAIHQPINLAWDRSVTPGVNAIEVYPAVTLKMLNWPSSGYKKKDQLSARQKILAKLKGEIALPSDTSTAETDADVLDAIVCVLAGQDFLAGRANPPDQEFLDCAKKEGWIWVRG